ncbi:MAG: hypothetical protein WCP99_14505 [Burkholderiales bacterium]
MLRFLMLSLLLFNGFYFAWTEGAFPALGPEQQAEPQRLQHQLRPQALRLLTGHDLGQRRNSEHALRVDRESPERRAKPVHARQRKPPNCNAMRRTKEHNPLDRIGEAAQAGKRVGGGLPGVDVPGVRHDQRLGLTDRPACVPPEHPANNPLQHLWGFRIKHPGNRFIPYAIHAGLLIANAGPLRSLSRLKQDVDSVCPQGVRRALRLRKRPQN